MVGGIYWENPYAERLNIMRTYWKYNHLHAHRLILHRFVQKKKRFFFCLLAKKPVHRIMGAPAYAENRVA